MSFEALKRVVRGGTTIANDVQAKELLEGYPVLSNVTGLPVNTTIDSIGEYSVILPKIGKEVMGATIVMEAFVDGNKTARPVYLSTLIRKADLDNPMKGMLAEAAFKEADSFTNLQWIEAFKAAAPFHVENVETVERVINVAGGTRTIKPKILTLKSGAYKK